MTPDYEQPVADYPRFHAARTPDDVAYIDRGAICTYAQLDKRSNQVANGIIGAGCRPGDRLAYLGINSGAYVETFFAANKAKVVYVGVNWRLTPVELDYILNDAGVKLIFCDAQFMPMLETLREKVPSIERIINVDALAFAEWRGGFSAEDPQNEHAPQDTILQVYTSGTTGKPKGVVITNAAMSEQRRSEDGYGDWYIRSDEKETIINALPNSHIAGPGWLLVGIFRGAKLILMAAPDPGEFLDLIENERVTHLLAVPVVLQMMLEQQIEKPRDLSSLKIYHYGASPIAPALLKQAIEVVQCGFCQLYGMTETTGTMTVMGPEFHDINKPERLKSCGRAVPGVQIKICDPDGNELPTGDSGEIWLKTGAVMKEYWNKPEATAEAIVDGWYRTGDGGHLDDEGFLYVTDRIKDMIISGGENVYSTEVENALYEHPAVAETAVVGVPDEKWGEKIKGVVVFAKDQTATEEELIAFLRERLAGYKIPRLYEFIDALPRTASGKVQKFKLR